MLKCTEKELNLSEYSHTLMDNTEFDKFARLGRGISSATLWDYQSAVNAYVNPTIIEERPLNVAQMVCLVD